MALRLLSRQIPTVTAPLRYKSLARPFLSTLSAITSAESSSPSNQRTFISTSHKMSSGQVLQGFESRRTYYALESSSPISDDRIHEIIQAVVKHTPSSFNSQSTRVLVLLADEHKQLWNDIVKPAVKAVAPPEAWEGSEKRLSGFANGYGTVSLMPSLK